MSLKDKLKEVVPEGWKRGAVLTAMSAAAMFAPISRAEGQTAESTPPTPAVTQEVQANANWTWNNEDAQKVYDGLPDEYKAFAGKDFMQRLEMQEEWEQRDYLKRDKLRSDALKRNPNARIGDAFPDSKFPNDSLSDVQTGTVRLGDHVDNLGRNGELTPQQAKMASEMIKFGRPLATLNPNDSYAKTLQDCGFGMMAEVANGRTEHSLNAREHAMLIAEIQEASPLKEIGNHAEEARELRIRTAQEDQAEYDRTHGFLSRLFATKTTRLPESAAMTQFENINGKTVAVPNPRDMSYSIRDEVTRRTAEKIEREDAQAKGNMARDHYLQGLRQK